MKKITALSAIALMSIAGFASATGTMQHTTKAPRHHQWKQGTLPHDLQVLNLNSAQKAQIQKILAANRPTRPAEPSDAQKAQFEQRIQAQRAAEQRLINNKTFNEAEARRLVAERKQHLAQDEQQRETRAVQMLKVRHDIFQVLTPAQQKQWLDQQTKHHEHSHVQGRNHNAPAPMPQP